MGEDISILQLAKLIKEVVGYKGKIIHDLSKPDGTPRKLMDVSKLNALGWSAQIDLKDGITSVYKELSNEPWYTPELVKLAS